MLAQQGGHGAIARGRLVTWCVSGCAVQACFDLGYSFRDRVLVRWVVLAALLNRLPKIASEKVAFSSKEGPVVTASTVPHYGNLVESFGFEQYNSS